MTSPTWLLLLLSVLRIGDAAVAFRLDHPTWHLFSPDLTSRVHTSTAASSSATRQCPQNSPRNESSPLISPSTTSYVDSLLDEWNSTGLALAVVQKVAPSGEGLNATWRVEFASFGEANTNSKVTPDTLFAIASNSKLFLSISVGLLVSNESLSQEFQAATGKKLGWMTKMKDVFAFRKGTLGTTHKKGKEKEVEVEWQLWDDVATNGVTIQDLLSHRTGLPRHDYSGNGSGVERMIQSLKYLRPSAEMRQATQYNNLMYETLTYLPRLLLDTSYEDYVQTNLLDPLDMASTTFSVSKAEQSGHLADGHLYHMQDFGRGQKGSREAIIPYFFRPGEETTWAGAGGVISSARDLSNWVSMLLNDGRHPTTGVPVVPKEVLNHVEMGRAVMVGKPDWPEISPIVYGSAQFRYSYQGLDILEHGGNNPGFKSQVARFPAPPVPPVKGGVCIPPGTGLDSSDASRGNAGLGIISLSNDGTHGGFVLEAAKWRVAEDIFGLTEVDWSARYAMLWENYQKTVKDEAAKWLSNDRDTATSHKPKDPEMRRLQAFGTKKFEHPSYGTIAPCFVPQISSPPADAAMEYDDSQVAISPFTSFFRKKPKGGVKNPYANCAALLSSPTSQRIIKSLTSTPAPIFIASWDRSFATHLVFTHFKKNTFYVSVVWSNAETRAAEGLPASDLLSKRKKHRGDAEINDEGSIFIGLDNRFEVEWITEGSSDAPSSRTGRRNKGKGEALEGLAFRSGFWGAEGIDWEAPDGNGKDGAEVWFDDVRY